MPKRLRRSSPKLSLGTNSSLRVLVPRHRRWEEEKEKYSFIIFQKNQADLRPHVLWKAPFHQPVCPVSSWKGTYWISRDLIGKNTAVGCIRHLPWMPSASTPVLCHSGPDFHSIISPHRLPCSLASVSWVAPQSSGAPPGSPNKINNPRTVNLQTFSAHFLSPALSHSLCSAPREDQSSCLSYLPCWAISSLEVGLTSVPSAEHHKEKWKHSCAVREMLRAGERSWGHLTLSPPKLLKAIPVKRRVKPQELTFGSPDLAGNSLTSFARGESEKKIFFLDLFEEKPAMLLF